MIMKKMYGKRCGYTGLSQPLLDGATKGDKFPHVHVSTYSLKTRKTTNYRINCDAYDDFDGHCTHAEPAGGKIILVNFMYHKIMVVDMEAFPGAPSEDEE